VDVDSEGLYRQNEAEKAHSGMGPFSPFLSKKRQRGRNRKCRGYETETRPLKCAEGPEAPSLHRNKATHIGEGQGSGEGKAQEERRKELHT
jgi:hypothetical protein